MDKCDTINSLVVRVSSRRSSSLPTTTRHKAMSNPNRPILRRSARNDVSFKDRHGWEALGVELEGVVLAVFESANDFLQQESPWSTI
jgi:hypothetical protein